MKKINELLTLGGWKLLCRLTLLGSGLDVDPEAYGDTIARRIVAKYGNKPVNDQYQTYVDMEGEEYASPLMAADLALTYGESWKRILDALTAEYNPIENYDKYQYDEAHNNSDGKNTFGQRTDIKGQQIDTDGEHTITYGEQTNTKGEQINTEGQEEDTKGQQINTDGAHLDEHEHQVSAYNSNGYNSESKDIDNIAQKQMTEGQRIDTKGERQDTEGQREDTIGEHEDTYGEHQTTYGQRSDTKGAEVDLTHDEGENTLDSHVHGNVGVTTNQQMINQEIDMRLRWKFTDIVTKDIVNEMTLRCY